ncbi:MAG: hypothetical protein B7Y49_00560 [Sphingomonas sp. 28-62-11]|nr:MAG: hypothetical protein B7Y49_00560 [Sphingomonas sp. 28-62-11]
MEVSEAHRIPAGSAPRGFNRVVDLADDVANRFRVPLSILSVGLFVLTCADYAGFLRLPNVVVIGGTPGLIVAVAFNAIWWGFLYPRAEKRRAERTTHSHPMKAKANG